MLPIYENYITNNSEESQKIDEFSSEYDTLDFSLTEIESKMRKFDTLIGSYSTGDSNLTATVNFFENDSGTWTITATGLNLESSATLEVSFDYEDFKSMINTLKTIFLNLEDTDELPVWICGDSYILQPTKE